MGIEPTSEAWELLGGLQNQLHDSDFHHFLLESQLTPALPGVCLACLSRNLLGIFCHAFPFQSPVQGEV